MEMIARILVFASFLLLTVGEADQKGLLSLEERVASLQEQLIRRPVLRLNYQKFRMYARSTPRNYSMVILLTAQRNQQCQACNAVQEEFEVVASSYRFGHTAAKRVYFALADFDDASEVFHALSVNAVPVIIHIPMRGTPKANDRMDFSRVGFSAEVIVKWVHDKTDVQIRILRPANYAGPVAMLLLFILVGGLLYMKRNSLDFLYSSMLWSVLLSVFVFAFLSGQMWNQIRGPPFMHKNPQTGRMLIIASSSQMQFVAETYLVFLLYAGITFAYLLLMTSGSTLRDVHVGNKKMNWMAFIGFIMVIVLFSYMLSIFRMKTHGYPYRLLFQ